jgi:hypothetical protein
MSELLLLGEFSTTGALEGDTVSFTNPDLSVFLNLLSYREDGSEVVTLLLERQNSSTSQTRFASKEASSLETGSAAPVGTYAPNLNLDAVWDWEADFNEDGVVDEFDLQYWRNSYGVATDARKLQGDADGDGDVDGRDFLFWQRQFNSGMATLQSNSLGIPEPSSCLLTATGWLMWVTRARRCQGACR